MKDKKTCYFCLSSANSPISDGFISITRQLESEVLLGNCYLIGTPFSIPAEYHYLPNVLIVKYSKNIRGLFVLIKYVFKTISILRKNEITNLFTYSSSYLHMFFILFMPKKIGLTVWIHDPIPHTGERKYIIFLKKINDFFLYKCKNKIDFIVASEFLRKILIDKKIDAKKINTLRFPYLPELATAEHIKNVSEPKIGKVRVVFFGRLESYKGLEWFFQALLEFQKEITPFELYVIGRGDLPKSLHELKGIGIEVTVLNTYIPNHQLGDILAKSSIAVFPYRDATASQAPQTSGALGCYNIVSDVGALSDCICKEYSRLVHKDDKELFISVLNEAISSKIEHKKISTEYLNKFSMKTFSLRLFSMLKEK